MHAPLGHFLIIKKIKQRFGFAIFNKNYYCFNTQAKISGATIVASDSTMNFGV